MAWFWPCSDKDLMVECIMVGATVHERDHTVRKEAVGSQGQEHSSQVSLRTMGGLQNVLERYILAKKDLLPSM